MNKIKHLLTFTFLLLSLSLFSGCVKPFQDLLPLREKIVEQYKENSLNLVIQYDAIAVSFINSSFNKLGQSQKEAKAKEIAVFVKENYESMDTIDMIMVSFTIHKTSFFIFDDTNSLDTFFYKIEELNK